MPARIASRHYRHTSHIYCLINLIYWDGAQSSINSFLFLFEIFCNEQFSVTFFESSFQVRKIRLLARISRTFLYIAVDPNLSKILKAFKTWSHPIIIRCNVKLFKQPPYWLFPFPHPPPSNWHIWPILHVAEHVSNSFTSYYSNAINNNKRFRF